MGNIQRGGFFLRSFPINIPKSKANQPVTLQKLQYNFSNTTPFPPYISPLRVNSIIIFILQIRSLRLRNIKDLSKVTELVSSRLNTESQIYLSSISNSVPLSPYQGNQGLYILGSEVKKELGFPLNTNPSQRSVTNKRLTLPRRCTKNTNFQLV